ncbi:putative acetyltransferase [Georgenia subflava]|uniref:putative acetyltransferase n=1 Tax=Georgenia subflava TaxID=1622177 RepID=UPI001D02CA40|nr:acetyltransferase [Georgenia subflava]
MEHDDDRTTPDEAPEAERDAPPPGEPPWLRWQVGERVVVRYRLEEADDPTGGRPRLSDALGDLVAVRADGVVVRTRRGDVHVPAGAMVTGKRVPPPPDPARYRRTPPPSA